MLGEIHNPQCVVFYSNRNRTKNITIVNTAEAVLKIVGVYIDNIRDNQHKVSFISVKVGSRPDEFVKFGTQDLDPRSTGWTWFPVECKLGNVMGFRENI